jgi:hypothetical protein
VGWLTVAIIDLALLATLNLSDALFPARRSSSGKNPLYGNEKIGKCQRGDSLTNRSRERGCETVSHNLQNTKNAATCRNRSELGAAE